MPTFNAVWEKDPKKLSSSKEKDSKVRFSHFFLRLAPTEFGNVDLNDLYRYFEVDDEPNVKAYRRYVPNFAVVVAMAFSLGSLICFLTLLIQGISVRNETFLALKPPPKRLARCDEVPLTLTEQFLASFEGTWQTSARYNNADGFFQVTFVGGQLNLKDYESVFRGSFKAQAAALGHLSSQRWGMWQIMALSTLAFGNDDLSINMVTNVDASIALNTLVPVAALSSSSGVCRTNEQGNYLFGHVDLATRAIMLEMPVPLSNATVWANADGTYNRLIAEPCTNAGPWVADAFNPSQSRFDGGRGKFSYDIRSTFLAIALNTGITSLNQLTVVNTEYLTSLGLYGLQDPYYQSPIMHQIVCIDKGKPANGTAMGLHGFSFSQEQRNGPEICFIINNARTDSLHFFYPVAEQFHSSPVERPSRSGATFNSPCRCPRDALSVECNRQQFGLAFIYTKNFSSISTNKFDSSIFALGVAMQAAFLAAEPAEVKASIERVADTAPGAVLYSGKGELACQDITSPMLLNTISVASDMDGQNATVSSGTGPKDAEDENYAPRSSPRAALQRAWRHVDAGLAAAAAQLPGGLPGTASLPPLRPDAFGAIVFETSGVLGRHNAVLLMTPNDIELGKLSEATYFDPIANAKLARTMCIDTLSGFNATTGLNAYDQMAAVPPVPLTQPYYVCQKTMRAVVLQQIAEAFSQAFLYAQIMWITAGLLIVKLIKYCEPKRDGVRRILTTLSKREAEESKRKVEETYAAMKDATVLHAIETLQEQISELQRTLRGIPSLSASRSPLPEEYSPSADAWDSPRNTRIHEVMLRLHATHRDVFTREDDEKTMLEKMCKILKETREADSSDAPDSSPMQRTHKPSISRRLTEATFDAVEQRCSTVRRNTSLTENATSGDKVDRRVSSLSASPLHMPFEVDARLSLKPGAHPHRQSKPHEPTSALGSELLSRGSVGAPEFTLNDAFGDAEEGCVTGERP